jgi:hypothetical protein
MDLCENLPSIVAGVGDFTCLLIRWNVHNFGIASLTPDHKKSGIDPILVCSDGVWHTVGKLLRRATTLLQTSSQSEVWAGSYEFPKSRESKLGQFRDSSLGIPGIKAIWMRVPRSNAKNTIWGKVVASPESRPWWVKWVQGRPWLVPTPKRCRMSFNQLVGWFWDAGPNN